MKKTLLGFLFLFVTLLINNQYVNGQIALWNFFGQSSPATFAATTFDPNLVATSGANNITRGPGAASSAGSNSFRTTGFKNDGISVSNTDYFQITLTANAGYKVSLSTIDANFAGTSSFYATPGVTSQFAYSLDGTTFTLIGSPVTSTSLTLSTISLTGISALQNVTAGTTIYLRYYASGQTATGGWGFASPNNNSTNGLAIGCTVVAAGPIDPATQLKFQNAPITGVPNASLSSFNVKAVAVDGVTVDGSYSTNITITKASGPGNLTGTTVKTPVGGIATFNDLKFDAPGTYTLTASSGSLTSATTADIVVADGTVNTDHFRARLISGNWSTANSWESSHDSASWIIATAVPDNNASSIVIGADHAIDFNANGSVRKLLVNGGTLNILPSVTLTITDDGTATKDFVIKGGGIVLNKGSLSIGSGATWQVTSDGTFIQNTTTGISTPLSSATLDAGSDFVYRGSSTLGITPSVSGKTYGNLILESESGVWSSSASGSGAFTVNGYLSIGENVTWNMTGYSGTMTVAENINISGVLTATSFSVASTKSLLVLPSGTLIIPTGKTVDVSNGSAVLKSDYSGSGSIGNSGGTLTGNISQERYIPAKAARKWSFLSSPFTQSIANSWQQQIHITGAGTGGTVCPTLTTNSNGFDATISNAPSVYTYNAANAQGSRWTALASTTTNVGQGVGFRVNVRGDRTLGCSLLDGTSMVPGSVVLKSTGSLGVAQKNMSSFSITYPNSGVNNYVLIGNPYPSAISFGALQTANNTIIDNKYAIYLPDNATSVYTYWDGVSGKYVGGGADMNFDNSKGDIIANGQAIFVQSSIAGDITLNFTESQKSTGTNAGYFRTPRVFNEMVKVGLSQNNHQIDEAVIRYANDAGVNNTDEGNLDIRSMNSGTYISSLKATKGMVVQTRDLKTLSNDEVWLNIGATESGTYQLNFSDFENFGIAEIFLKDHYTNTTQNIKQNDTYAFSVDKNNAATKGSTRFSVVFNRTTNPVYVTNMIKMYPNPANKKVTFELPQTADNTISYSIKVTDLAGKVVMQQKVNGGTHQLTIDKLTTGTYFVEVIDSKGNRTTEKLIKN